MMADQYFDYDVFLSHASADKAAVRELAERLKGDGLRVWLDEWVIQPGDMVSLKIEQGLESSRTLVLVMSQAAFDSEWVTLERHTALFRDPTNQQRRFIPLRLDDCAIEDTFKQYAYVDWREMNDDEYERLLRICGDGYADVSSHWRNDRDNLSGPEAMMTDVATEKGTMEVDIVIDREFDEYSDEEQRRLLQAIEKLLGVGGDVRITRKRRGSVILRLELSTEEAERLVAAVTQGEFAELGVVEAGLVEPTIEPTNDMVCPFCLATVSVPGGLMTCPSCAHELPRMYLQESTKARNVFVPVIGRAGAGKTTFISAAMHDLGRLSAVLPGFVSIPATASTLDYQRQTREEMSRGVLPDPTPVGATTPMILLLKGLPRWENIALTMYDSAGEVFEDFQFKENIPLLIRSSTAILVCSMADMERSHDMTVDELLLSYVNTLRAFGSDPEKERRRIVVALTKADLIVNRLPTRLAEYVTNPKTQPTATGVLDTEDGLNRYFETMVGVSQDIEEWFSHQRGGKSLINLARSQNIELRFAICSALGGAPTEEGQLTAQVQPRRILDPLMWLLESRR
jgi:hypothetical protein